MIRNPEFLDIARCVLRPHSAALGNRLAGAIQRAGEAFGIDRFHQIIDRRDIEGGDREIVERGDEDDGGIDGGRGEFPGHFDAIHAGHGDVEQQQVGRQRPAAMPSTCPGLERWPR